MIVFNTVLKIVNKYKFIILLYTILLIIFSSMQFSNDNPNITYAASKPDICIINNDDEVGLTKTLVEYLEKNANIISLENNETAINDALFYRDVVYVIYIPKNFHNDLKNGKNPEIAIKRTNDVPATLADNLLEQFVETVNIYSKTITDEKELINKVTATLEIEPTIELTAKLDTNELASATAYFNFLNYSLLAGLVYIICLVLSSFKEEKIIKRTIISSTKYTKLNKYLLLSSSLISIILWILNIIIGIILHSKIIISIHGLILVINSFLFMICALTIAFLIGNIISNKNDINGIINVLALGSSFLCGAFVPTEYLPSSVLKIAHILPSYWYIQTNESLKGITTFNLKTMQPILINMSMIIIFAVIFIVITNIISNKKRKIN